MSRIALTVVLAGSPWAVWAIASGFGHIVAWLAVLSVFLGVWMWFAPWWSHE